MMPHNRCRDRIEHSSIRVQVINMVSKQDKTKEEEPKHVQFLSQTYVKVEVRVVFVENLHPSYVHRLHLFNHLV